MREREREGDYAMTVGWSTIAVITPSLYINLYNIQRIRGILQKYSVNQSGSNQSI